MSLNEVCLYQLTRPYITSDKIMKEGVGDCNTCMHDEVKNCICKAYQPFIPNDICIRKVERFETEV